MPALESALYRGEFGGHTPYLSPRAGSLSGGTIDVNPVPACINDTITFTLNGVVDSGGQKRENCVVVSDGPVTPDYTWTLTIPSDFPAPLPPLSGSGRIVSVVAKVPGTYRVTYVARADRECDPPSRTIGPEVVVVPGVTALVWEKFSSANAAIDTCPNNGGKRMFPGKLDPGDGLPADRRKVVLKATVDPLVDGCKTVYFKIWDVDDPFDQNNAGMANVNLIDGNTSDN